MTNGDFAELFYNSVLCENRSPMLMLVINIWKMGQSRPQLQNYVDNWHRKQPCILESFGK